MSISKKPAPKKAPATKTAASKSVAPSPTKESLFGKAASTVVSTPPTPTGTTLRIIKKGTCASRSEKSTLTYAIACDPDKEIFFQVTSNSGGGFFSQEWISFTNIERALAGGPDVNRITSFCLYPLFKGKSVNTPAFLLAVLVAENLLKPLPNCKRVHELVNSEDFLARMAKLIATKVNLPDETDQSKPKLAGASKSANAASKPLPKARPSK